MLRMRVIMIYISQSRFSSHVIEYFRIIASCVMKDGQTKSNDGL